MNDLDKFGSLSTGLAYLIPDCRHIPYAEFKQKEGWTSDEDTDGGYPIGLRNDQLGWGSE